MQTVPVVGIAGGLSNPIYMNKVKAYAEAKYHKRRLLIQLREARGEVKAPEAGPQPGELTVSVYDPDGTE